MAVPLKQIGFPPPVCDMLTAGVMVGLTVIKLTCVNVSEPIELEAVSETENVPAVVKEMFGLVAVLDTVLAPLKFQV